GEWVGGAKTFENRNPANTDEVVGLFAKGMAQDVADAAAAAAAAFPAWAAMPAPARGNLLYKAADILDRKFDQLGADMTREEGKTLPEAKGEVRRAINILRYFGGEGSRMPGMMVPSERDRVHMFAIRKPLGVVGLITPWNFPSAIPAWKLAPALVCGNTVVLKPASASPLSAWRIVEALHEAGIPKGVVNFVAGSGGELGKALVGAKSLKAISFTGSCAIGNWLHQEASKRRLRIQLEMGGKNPTIVLADADFNSAVENVVNAAFFSTGQKCTATSRAIIEDAIYDRFKECRQRGVLFHGPEMHRHQPCDHRRCHLRPLRFRGSRADAEAQGRRRHRGRYRDRTVRGPGSDGYGARLHRKGPPGKRPAQMRRPAAD